MDLSSAVAFVLLATGAPAAPASHVEPPVELRVDVSTSPSAQIDVLEVKPRLGRDLELFLRITNVSDEHVGTVELSVVQRDRRGRTRAYESFLKEADLRPGGQLYLMRRTDHFSPRPGDVFFLAVQPYLEASPSESTSEAVPDPALSGEGASISCVSFADKCAEHAARLCGQAGVSAFECLCEESALSHKLECGA